MAQEAVRHAVRRIPADQDSQFKGILRQSLITERSMIPAETREALDPIIGPYLTEGSD